jgi:flagellar biosynthesis protein
MKPPPFPKPLRVVALRHERPAAPRVSAKGQGELGARLLALARAHAVPVREDPDLVELLSACDLGQEVPSELFQAVAELLVFLQGMNTPRSRSAAGGSVR